MKFVIQKDILLEKIILASRFIFSKISSITNLQGICLKGEKDTLNIYSTNLNQYYHGRIKTEIKDNFLIIIDPKKITEFLTLLPSGKVDLLIEKERLLLSQKNIKGEFFLFKEKEFPLPPAIKEKSQKIETTFFKKNLPLVLFSTSTDDSRPILTGVNFVVEENQIIMVATDGFRLSMLKLPKEIDLPSIIIPARFLNEILTLIKNEEKINFFYSNEEKMIKIEIGEDEFFSRLIEGEFPPFEKVIPSQTNTSIEVNKDEFLRNIKLTSVFSRDYSNIIVLKIKENKLIFQPKVDSNEQKEIVIQEAKTKGEENKIAFNYKFLIDLLNRLSCKEIIIEFLKSDSPAVFKTKENPNFLHIIMPVRIQD